MSQPHLSVIVIFHNMPREAPRTLLSLSPAYQRGVDADDYEVIAIDNGSDRPLDAAMVQRFGAGFHYQYHPTTSVSPVEALNLGAQIAQGQALAFIVDGARMASPGLIAGTLRALRISQAPFIAGLSWHLGPNVQNISMLEGYNQQVEDGLLDKISWPEDGTRLFEISTLAQSSRPGFLGGFPVECSWVCTSRALFEALDGYDPAFTSPGGGLVNHDFVNRAKTLQNIDFISLIGEGVFHQFHGGVATNVQPKDHPIQDFKREYEVLRGTPYAPPQIEDVIYLGAMPDAARRFVARADTS